MIGLSYATYLRWKNKDVNLNVDKRLKEHRTYFEPKNKLSEFEYHMLNHYLNCEEYKHLSPIQIVPKLMDDKGIYIASESTFYRFMGLTGQNTHRGSTRKPRTSNKPNELVATASNQVYCWDITYLNSNVKGHYFYLYMYIDIFDKYITGWQVFDSESSENASLLIQDIYEKENIQPNQLVIHSDNGSPMKGQSMKAMLEALGVSSSHSRPRVSNDNPMSESLFKTLKYNALLPLKPFGNIQEAREWVHRFVQWYNHEHLHSSNQFITPADKRAGKDVAKLQKRQEIMNRKKESHPNRWAKGRTRDWSPITKVTLNEMPEKEKTNGVA